MTELLWWHRPGQKIVCVEPFGEPSPLFCGQNPKVGETYTIRDAHIANCLVGFYLQEISLWFVEHELDYGATLFRPVREPSIESLRALLSPTPDEARAREPADA